MRGKLLSDSYYIHVFNKSIAGYDIFNSAADKKRFLTALSYYNNMSNSVSLSHTLQMDNDFQFDPLLSFSEYHKTKIICYCVMPDHYHLLLKADSLSLLSKFVNDYENSYTRYLNLKRERKGPLWQSKFKKVLISSEEALLHVSRYIHLNPVTSYLVDRPEDWEWSSYREYIFNPYILTNYVTEVAMTSQISYRKFVEGRIDYQRKLKWIRRYLL